MQTITKRVLTSHHLDAGLYTEEDDHCLYIYSKHSDKCLAVFTIYTSLKEIWETADKLVKEKKWLINKG